MKWQHTSVSGATNGGIGSMFNTGDLVRLSSNAVLRNIDSNHRMFPGLTEHSVLVVRKQHESVVYIETESPFNRLLHEQWLELAVENAE